MDHTTTTQHIRQHRPFMIHRDFRLLWVGGAISVIGDQIFDFTLILWVTTVLARTPDGQLAPWAALAISGLLLAVTIPTLLVGMAAGVYVDRWDKRRTLMRMDLIRAFLIGLLVLATNSVPLPFLPNGRLPLVAQLVAIYSIVALATIAAQFFNPARVALVGDLVPEASRAQASGLMMLSGNLAILIGPALAPGLFLLVGPAWAIAINACSFLWSFLMVGLIHAPPAARSVALKDRASFGREFVAGLRFVARSRILAMLVLISVVIMFGAGPMNALDILFALQNLHAPLALYGLLTVGMGIGAVLGALVAGPLAPRVGLLRTHILALCAIAILLLVYSRLTSFWPAVVLLTLIGFLQSVLNVPIGPLILRVTPRALVGRVIGIFNPIISLAMIGSTLLAGWLASNVLLGFRQQVLGMTFGPIDTIFSAGAVLALLAAISAIFVIGFHDPVPPPEADLPVPGVMVAASSSD